MNTQINEDYVSYEIAKLLKEKGFNELTCGYYYDNYIGTLLVSSPSNHNGSINAISAPSQGHTMKWLREKNIIIVIQPEYFNLESKCSAWEVEIWCDDNYEKIQGNFFTYEEACEAAIKYCITNLI